MAAGKTAADHAALVHIAATLINVEDRLDRDLIGLIVPKPQAVPGSPGSIDVDFQQVQAAVLRECSVNLVRVKEAIASTSPARSTSARSIPGRGSSPESRRAC